MPLSARTGVDTGSLYSPQQWATAATTSTKAFETAALGAVWSTALAVALGSGLPVVAAEVKEQSIEERTALVLVQPAFGYPHAVDIAQVTEPLPDLNVPASLDAPFEEEAEADPDDWFSIEFGTEFLFELEENFDLDDQDPGEDATIVEFPLSVKFTFNPTAHLLGVASFELNREVAISEEVKETKVIELKLQETYISIENFLDGYTFRVGRQRFRDDREWLFGGRRGLFLDGVLLRYAGGMSTPWFEIPKLNVDFSVNRQEIVARDLLNPDRGRKADRIINYFLSTEWSVNDRFMVGGHLVFRDDLEKEETRSLFLAATSRGRIIDDVSYWAAFSHVRGEDQATQLSGFGFDLGATVSLGLPVGPYFTVGYAFGSGDDDPDDDTDKTHRQTGLHANTDRFGGIIDFAYYGEVFNPELSNIHILTAGVGVTPTENTSIDVVYHVYRQEILAGELRRVGVDADLNNPPRSKRLGSAVDVIAGWTDILDLEMTMEFKLGYFFPGSAYPDDADDDAFFVSFEFEYEF